MLNLPQKTNTKNAVIKPGKIVVSEQQPATNSFFNSRTQLRSLLVGVACGMAVLLVFGFIVFNEMVIAPFIRPNQSAQLAPVTDRAGAPVDTAPKVRIPKIGLDIPVVYGASADEKQFELALDQGVVHYPTTVLPGRLGNTVYFGHSSNNLFNPGKYKFAFVLLHELAPGDTFYLTHDGTLYTYEVVSKQVVPPTDFSVLDPVPGIASTATLITCDPPGTSNNRLVVVGKQTNPTVDGNDVPVAAQPETVTPERVVELPGNGPGLLKRLWRSII